LKIGKNVDRRFCIQVCSGSTFTGTRCVYSGHSESVAWEKSRGTIGSGRLNDRDLLGQVVRST